MPTYRVLSFDGGGVRGLMTTMLLERLCQQPGLEHAFDGIDLIAGNSSGALVALAMAHGLGHPASERFGVAIASLSKGATLRPESTAKSLVAEELDALLDLGLGPVPQSPVARLGVFARVAAARGNDHRCPGE